MSASFRISQKYKSSNVKKSTEPTETVEEIVCTIDPETGDLTETRVLVNAPAQVKTVVNPETKTFAGGLRMSHTTQVSSL